LNDLDMRACQACNDCLRTGECVLEDDMSPLYALLERADAIVIACPIYFSGLTAQTKMMIDRCQCLWARGENLGRPVGGGKKRKGAFISVGGDEKSVFRNAVGEVKAFYCAINVSYCEELLVSGVEKKGAIGERPATLKEAFELGKRIVSDSRPS